MSDCSVAKKVEATDTGGSEDKHFQQTRLAEQRMAEETGDRLRETLRQWTRSWRKEWRMAAYQWINEIKLRCSIGYSLLGEYDDDYTYSNQVIDEYWIEFPAAKHNRTFICTTENSPSLNGVDNFKLFRWIVPISYPVNEVGNIENQIGVDNYALNTSELLRYRKSLSTTAATATTVASIPENLWVGLFMCVTNFFEPTFDSGSQYGKYAVDVVADGTAVGENYLCIRPQHYNPQLIYFHQNEQIHAQVAEQLGQLTARKANKLENKDGKDNEDDENCEFVWFRYDKTIGLNLFPDGKMDNSFFSNLLRNLHDHQQRRLATLYFQWHHTSANTSTSAEAAQEIVKQAVSLINNISGNEKKMAITLPSDNHSVRRPTRFLFILAISTDEEIAEQVVSDQAFARYFPKLTPENIVTILRWFFESRKDHSSLTFLQDDVNFPSAADNFADFDNLSGRLADTLYSRKLVAYECCCNELHQLSRSRVLLHELVNIVGQYLPVATVA